MGHKNQFPIAFQWQVTNPAIGFLPLPANQNGSAPSGVITSALSGTNTIYSQIIDLSRLDVLGLEVTFTGTPTGTLSVMASNSGINFYSLTFDPALTQPTGSGLGYVVNIAKYSFKYVMLQYTNSSGTGTLTVYGQSKDWN